MTTARRNAATGSPRGPEVGDFTPPAAPAARMIDAGWVRLEPLSSGHADALFDAYRGHDGLWDYIPDGPHPSREALWDWIAAGADKPDPVFLALVTPEDGQARGQAAFMRIDRFSGVIEIGFIVLSPVLQGSRAGSAALMAMIRWAFEAGYRRVEWKCDALNAPSRRAAHRLGFAFEGVFRQHMIVKGRNRDTAWFAIIDRDWPALRDAYDIWLSPGNFDAKGRQRQSLSRLTGAALPGRPASTRDATFRPRSPADPEPCR
ncbi:MAG: GNAT family N-acetyltransferase [Paracoccus sp.]|nr:GNAT family N-acetyltransferase [Paracoccus sp. (in: a-proteobacteria)]